jgi:transglutaminase-like putative cysteine protease
MNELIPRAVKDSQRPLGESGVSAAVDPVRGVASSPSGVPKRTSGSSSREKGGERMILEVQHETRLKYTEAVTEWVSEVRMEPTSDAAQSCHSFHLAVTPPAEVFRYQDGFGNCVHHFNLLSVRGEVRILAASIVETYPQPRDPAASRATYPCDLRSAGLEALDFLKFRGPVRPGPRLARLLETLRPSPDARLADVVARVGNYIHDHFEYARAVTLASSPIDDVLEHGKGVCQDFTHLMIAVLRSLGVPARYVSGYLHRPDKQSQSHAWCEVLLPDVGWVGMDPTNHCFANEHFVKVATGRDFTDVPPNRGVYRGGAEESIFVRVETRQMERVPPLSWQEQLPPLNVPLTAIVGPRREGRADEEGAEQQQQQ